MRRFLSLAAVAIIVILMGIVVQAFAQGNAFEHEDISLTLPDGWVTQDIPSNFEKEVIGWLKSEKIPGTSITVSCYRGRL